MFKLFIGTESIGILKSCHVGRYEGRGAQGLNVMSMPQDIILQAHFYILNNVDKIQPYLSTNKKTYQGKISPNE